MSNLQRVLVAVDFSAPARAAFDHALALARSHGADLLVVHAVPADRRFDWRIRERLALIHTLRHAADTAGVRFTVSVQHGDPAGVILLHATARDADVIVLGTSARSGLERLRRGSVAETVTLKAAPPVLVVPSPSGLVDASVPRFNSILVAVDLTRGSSTAVEHALAMAHETSRVTLVHVAPGLPMAGSHRYRHHAIARASHRQLAQDARQRIAEVIPASVRAARPLHTRIATGDPAASIVRVADDIGADVIVMGVTSRGAVGRMFLGSTAARVIRTARRPVLAIPQRPAQARRPVSDGEELAAAA